MQNFTQYIPLSIYNLQTWMGVPSIYVLDCSAAATIIHHFQQFAEQREHEVQPPSTPGTEGCAPCHAAPRHATPRMQRCPCTLMRSWRSFTLAYWAGGAHAAVGVRPSVSAAAR